MSIGAMKQALEALELGYDSAKSEADRYHEAMAGYKPERHAQVDAEVQQIAKAITALRQAIEQAEQQEPVAWRDMAYANLGAVRDKMPPEQVTAVQDWLEKVCTAPPKKEWVGLTDEDILLIANRLWEIKIPSDSWLWFARAIEAKLRERNA